MTIILKPKTLFVLHKDTRGDNHEEEGIDGNGIMHVTGFDSMQRW